MPDNFTIRAGGPEDIAGMVAIQKEIYSEYKRDAAFFRWQCFANPNPAVIVIAEHAGRVVGTLGIQRLRTTGGLSGGQLSWIVIAKDHQRHGLFGMMAGRAIESMPGLDFIFIFANKAAVVPAEKKLGMAFIGRLHHMVRGPAGPLAAVTYDLEPVDSRTAFPLNGLSGRPTTFARTDAYRSWRYAGSSVYRYFKVSVSDSEYAVVKLFTTPASRDITGDIVDIECDIRDRDAIEKLYAAASFALTTMGASAVSTWAVPGTTLRRTIEDMGFSQSGHCSHFGIKLLGVCGNDPLDAFERWHLVQSDASNY